jgi:hypothetical protein
MRFYSILTLLALGGLGCNAIFGIEEATVDDGNGGSGAIAQGAGGEGAGNGGMATGGMGNGGMATGGMGTGGMGTGGEGGTGGETPTAPGPPGTDLVSAGQQATSPSYKMNFTLGQPTQNQQTATSPSYRMQGGLQGTNGSLP